MLILGLFLAMLGYMFFYGRMVFFTRHFSQSMQAKIKKWFIAIASILLFCVQMIIASNIMFQTGWDAGAVFTFAYETVNLNPPDYTHYFSMYPNNLFITWFYTVIIRLYKMVSSTFTMPGALFSLIIVNSIISCVTGVLVFRITTQLTRKKLWGFAAWCVYAVVIGLSPWFLIPYSDAVGILFPVLMLYLYLRPNTPEPLRWSLIGLFAYIGYQMKPSVAIALIAIAGIQTVSALRRGNAWKRTILSASSLLSTFVLLHLCFTMLIVPSLNLSLNKQITVGPIHFVKMGLNNQTDGVYLHEDVLFSGSFGTKEEQNAANIEVIQKRLDDFGFKGYLEFLTRKGLVNFNNGSFAWADEGTFYYDLYNKTSLLAYGLLAYYYSFGFLHILFLTFFSNVMAGRFVGCLFLFLCSTHRSEKAGPGRHHPAFTAWPDYLCHAL